MNFLDNKELLFSQKIRLVSLIFISLKSQKSQFFLTILVTFLYKIQISLSNHPIFLSISCFSSLKISYCLIFYYENLRKILKAYWVTKKELSLILIWKTHLLNVKRNVLKSDITVTNGNIPKNSNGFFLVIGSAVF